MVIIMNKRMLTLIIVAVLILVLAGGGLIFFSRDTNTTPTGSYQPTIKPIDQGKADSEFIAFTCNVDWGNEVIPEMLKILEEKEVKITFFVTGRWAKAFPEIFESIIAAGHEIGSHGYQHLNYSTLSLEKNQEEITSAEAAIMAHTKEKPKYFAPPSGAYNEHTLRAAEALGYETILWSIDTIDWRQGSTKDLILKRVLEKEDLQGKIVLMHPMEETAKALPELIDRLKEKGITVGRVSDVL